MDLQLTEKMATISTTLEFMQKTMDTGFKTTNDHLFTLNGKVLKQEKELDSQNRQLNDFQEFKKGVADGAKDKARIAATYRATIIAIIVPLLTMIAIYIIQKVFHIQLPPL